MSYESSSIRVPKIFQWNGTDVGKEEFDEFTAIFTQILSDRVWILDPTLVQLAVPEEPGPAPALNAAAAIRNEHRKSMIIYKESLFKMYKDFNFGINALRSLLPYPSMARGLLEGVIKNRPPEVAEVDWKPPQQFLAAMDKLKSVYARTTAADTETLRGKMMKLTDEGNGGFSEYRMEFCKLLSQLMATGIQNVVSETELREWVRKGIRNKNVLDHLIKFYIDNPEASYEQIFSYVEKYLVICSNCEIDPYRTVSGASGKVSINVASMDSHQRKYSPPVHSESMCTRCWMKGHSWRDCRRSHCGVCKAELTLNDKTCPCWKKHKSPDYRFRGDTPPWERDQFDAGKKGKSFQRGTKRPATSPPSSTLDAGSLDPAEMPTFMSSSETKQLRKALKVSLREDKKRKVSANG
jgi:hypothetical protein